MTKVNILTEATNSFRLNMFDLNKIFDRVGLENINFEEVNSDGNNILIEYLINLIDYIWDTNAPFCEIYERIIIFWKGAKILCKYVNINHSNHKMMTALDYATESSLKNIYQHLLSVNDNINPECIRKYINHPDYGDDTKEYLIKHHGGIYDESVSMSCVHTNTTLPNTTLPNTTLPKNDIDALKQTCCDLKEANDKIYSNYESLKLICLDLKVENTKLKDIINGVIRCVKSNSTSTPISNPTLDPFANLCRCSC
jgi:hypothetical protein